MQARSSVHLRGITAETTHSLLSTFAQWGTCYWKLFQMSNSNALGSMLSSPVKGVIHKVSSFFGTVIVNVLYVSIKLNTN